jgi:hypothetical protein
MPSVSAMGNPPMIIYLDEVETDASVIATMFASKIAFIKIFSTFMAAEGGAAGGAIAIYTKKVEDDIKTLSRTDVVNYTGFSVIKEFYSPDYEKPGIAPVNDLRSTLYWNPTLIMDKTTRRIKIPFYNNDNCKKIRVIVEGINEEGQLTREEKVFE